MKTSAWATPRDLLAIDPNPARIKVKDIVARLGICERTARELRAIATRAPEVLQREWDAVAARKRGRAGT